MNNNNDNNDNNNDTNNNNNDNEPAPPAIRVGPIPEPEDNLKYKNKNGYCTRFAFLCGYTETYGPEDRSLTLWQEPNDWHVRGFIDGERVWESFETLAEARRFARRTAGKLQH